LHGAFASTAAVLAAPFWPGFPPERTKWDRRGKIPSLVWFLDGYGEEGKLASQPEKPSTAGLILSPVVPLISCDAHFINPALLTACGRFPSAFVAYQRNPMLSVLDDDT
jgi:hypothetical protein